jgi:hypothetical protein
MGVEAKMDERMQNTEEGEEEREWAEFIRDAASSAELEKKGSMAVTSATCGVT